MKKPFILGAAGAAMLASCSSDEVISLNKQDMIRFNVQTELNTRAADVFCNNNMPSAFTLTAYSGSTVYFTDSYEPGDEGTDWTSTGIHYWPNEGNLDFYAYVKGDFDTANKSFKDFAVASTPETQVDLLYAVKKGQGKQASSVAINFRHALSQIVFQAKRTNENIEVIINSVSVCGVNGTGTYSLASIESDTDGNIEDHENGNTADKTNRGKWGSLSAISSYTASLSAGVKLENVNSTYPLTLGTTTDEDGKTTINTGDQSDYPDLAMLLIPQTTNAISITKGMELNEANGSYFLVNCIIKDKNSGIVLWGGENGKDVLVPVQFAWTEGKKYIYTFLFGDGNGGYDPENPDPEKPILVPITFSCTVDDFIKGEDKDIEMKTTSDKSGSTEGNNE